MRVDLMKELSAAGLVALGGGAGALLRYGVGLVMVAAFGTRLPLGTLVVNVVGCFVAGLLVGRFVPMHAGTGLEAGLDAARSAPLASTIPASTRLLVLVGFLGGLTTFSAFSLETVELARRESVGLAGLNVVLNVVFGLGAAWAGMRVAGYGKVL